MNLCSHGHEEVCFESRSCPMCYLQEEKETLEVEVKELESRINQLEEELAEEKK